MLLEEVTFLLHSHSEILYGVFCLRSEEHTSELLSHSEISYAVFCLKKKTNRCLQDWQRARPRSTGPHAVGLLRGAVLGFSLVLSGGRTALFVGIFFF